MSEPNRSRPQFDERAAEEELERVRGALEEWRLRRKQAADNFDSFLRSFANAPAREPRSIDPRAAEPRNRRATDMPRSLGRGAAPGAVPQAPAPPPAPAPPAQKTSVPLTTPAQGTAPGPEQAAGHTLPPPPASAVRLPGVAGALDPASTDRPVAPANEVPPPVPPVVPATDSASSPVLLRDARVVETHIPSSPRAKSFSEMFSSADGLAALVRAVPEHLRTRQGQAVAAGAVVVIAALLFGVFRGSSEDPATPPPSQAASTSPATAPAAPAAAAPAPAPVATSGFQVELTTTRRVWVRIIVDGQRAVERELPADERIPINPQELVVIRAGDAGAVRVLVNGRDSGPFGTDGFPATKSFKRP